MSHPPTQPTSFEATMMRQATSNSTASSTSPTSLSAPNGAMQQNSFTTTASSNTSTHQLNYTTNSNNKSATTTPNVNVNNPLLVDDIPYSHSSPMHSNHFLTDSQRSSSDQDSRNDSGRNFTQVYSSSERQTNASMTAPGHSPTSRTQGVVGNYIMERESVGEGTYGTVKLCRCRKTKKQRAIKIIPKDGEAARSVTNEIQTMKRVKNPNVVRFVDLYQSERKYYIVMEAVLGGDVFSLLEQHQGSLPTTEVKRLFTQLASGLQACHVMGVAHRDLKPDNLLLTSDGSLKIADFGLSRLHKTSRLTASEQEYASTLTGTTHYAAPEVLSNQRYDAFKADLWSLGCLLFVFLSGRFPFGDDDGDTLQERIARGEMDRLPPWTDPDACDLVQSLVRLDPNERLALKDVLEHPFIRDTVKAMNHDRRNATAAAASSGAPPLQLNSNDTMENVSMGSNTGFTQVDDSACATPVPNRMEDLSSYNFSDPPPEFIRSLNASMALQHVNTQSNSPSPALGCLLDNLAPVPPRQLPPPALDADA